MTAVTPTTTHPPSTRVRAGKIVANLSTAALYEAAVRDGEGLIAADGPPIMVVSEARLNGSIQMYCEPVPSAKRL